MAEIVLKDVSGVIRDALEANYGHIHRVTGFMLVRKIVLPISTMGSPHAYESTNRILKGLGSFSTLINC
jgi:hypothetical protein